MPYVWLLCCVRVFTRSLTRPPASLFVCSFVHSFLRLFVCSFIHSFFRSVIRLFICSIIRLFFRLFIRSFFHLPVRSFVRLVVCSTQRGSYATGRSSALNCKLNLSFCSSRKISRLSNILNFLAKFPRTCAFSSSP